MRPLTSNQKLAVAVAAFCLLSVVVSWPRREPEWNGRTLNEWLELSQSAHENIAKSHGTGPELAAYLKQREDAEDAFFMMGPAVLPRLVGIFEGYDSPIRAKLEQWSKSAGWNSHPFSGEVPPKNAAAAGLTALGPLAVSALPTLSNALFQPKPDYAALAPLVAIGTPAVPVLLAGLTNPHSSVQAVAFSGLAHIGTNASSIEPVLRSLQTHPDAAVRGRAIALLGATSPTNENPFPELLRANADPDPEFRRWVIIGMSMAARTRSTNTSGMAEAAAAVAEMAADRIVRNSRQTAAWNLQYFKSAAEPHIPVLLDFLKDADENIRYGAIVSLSALKLRRHEVIPALADMIADPKQHVREEAAAGLREMSVDVEYLRPGLMGSLGDLGKARYEQRRLHREDFERREAKRLERMKAKPEAKK